MKPLSWKAKEFTVGELSERSGVPTSALRFYERKGLIASRRTAGNQRRYSRDTLRRVAFIRASQQLGTPLGEIAFYLALLPEGRTPTREDWARASQCYSKDINTKIQRLEFLRDRLTDCIGCGCLSIDRCSLVTPLDEIGENATGAPRLYEP
ncbi:redox-sensitive transcriptional activator SoxR [Actinomadura terrae]|uniref:redox-sensitive transcriptional activator SoxR n=1 Tax=Actinomadura terrae TaxID=604353 RepID=UPI001FA7E0F5|nr:redox-sensitive transcriptional activator SoxR [Actinomadura terrae]